MRIVASEVALLWLPLCHEIESAAAGYSNGRGSNCANAVRAAKGLNRYVPASPELQPKRSGECAESLHRSDARGLSANEIERAANGAWDQVA
jgi:hypothetical protein